MYDEFSPHRCKFNSTKSCESSPTKPNLVSIKNILNSFYIYSASLQNFGLTKLVNLCQRKFKLIIKDNQHRIIPAAEQAWQFIIACNYNKTTYKTKQLCSVMKTAGQKGWDTFQIKIRRQRRDEIKFLSYRTGQLFSRIPTLNTDFW